jgi:tetratricopeptide (TPR) repeat protein
MRRDRYERGGRASPIRRILSCALLIAVALSATGCPKAPPRAKGKPGEPRRERAVPKDVVRPEQQAQDAVATPARLASNRLLDRGKAQLDSRDYSRAATTLRDAINVDTTNGAAYYYLALAQARLEQPDLALGLLDKAEALLGSDEGWAAMIEDLRREIGAPATHQVVPSPIDQAF